MVLTLRNQIRSFEFCLSDYQETKEFGLFAITFYVFMTLSLMPS